VSLDSGEPPGRSWSPCRGTEQNDGRLCHPFVASTHDIFGIRLGCWKMYISHQTRRIKITEGYGTPCQPMIGRHAGCNLCLLGFSKNPASCDLDSGKGARESSAEGSSHRSSARSNLSGSLKPAEPSVCKWCGLLVHYTSGSPWLFTCIPTYCGCEILHQLTTVYNSHYL